jgi:energy-converting hydrogenase Eha subunit C
LGVSSGLTVGTACSTPPIGVKPTSDTVAVISELALIDVGTICLVPGGGGATEKILDAQSTS